MAKKEYNEIDVARILNRNKDVSVDTHNKTITYDRNNSSIGNGSSGKIDYLVKVHGYTVINGKAKAKVINAEQAYKLRHAKREKLNMISMVKTAMKNAK